MSVRFMFELIFFFLCGVGIGTSKNIVDRDSCMKLAVLFLGIYVFFVMEGI